MKRSLLAICLVGCTANAPPPPSSAPAPSPSIEPVSEHDSWLDLVVEDAPVAPYDLAADLEARTKSIRAEAPKTKFEVVEDVFLIATPSGIMGSSAVVARKAIQAYFHERFRQKPKRAVAVILFDKAAPYEAYCKSHWNEECISPFGFYSHEVRTVVMNAGPGIGTLTHELVHPIVESDFPTAPDWINEGLASLYEGFSLPKDGEIRGHKNWRHPRLLKALKSKAERPYASLKSLFGMTDKEFRGKREDLNYATARYFCLWMEGQGKLWAFYRAWRDSFATDPTGEKAFRTVMGKSPSELDDTWAAWAKSL